MNARLSLAEFRTRLDEQLNANGAVYHCGTAYDHDYLARYETTYPAVWVLAQRLLPKGQDRGYSEYGRQHFRVEVAVRLVVQRFAAGDTDPETALNDLHDLVVAALRGWRPTGAAENLLLVQSLDGPPSDSLMSVDIVFFTEVAYARAA